MHKKEISIIIVTFNSSTLIGECLKSIKAYNDVDSLIEVIIVDNNSNDFQETAKIASDIIPDIKIIKNHQNGGYGQGNNIGIKASTGKIIMIMNPDVRLFKPLFSSVIKQYDDISLGVLGMQQYETPLIPRQSFLPLYPSPFSLLLYKAYDGLGRYSPLFFCIHGACFFIRKKALEDINYFDERIFLYNEEVDLHLRLKKKTTYKVKFDKSLGYLHPMHDRNENVDGIMKRIHSYLYVYEKNKNDTKCAVRNLISMYRIFQLRSLLVGDNNYRMYKTIITLLKKEIHD